MSNELSSVQKHLFCYSNKICSSETQFFQAAFVWELQTAKSEQTNTVYEIFVLVQKSISIPNLWFPVTFNLGSYLVKPFANLRGVQHKNNDYFFMSLLQEEPGQSCLFILLC